jgi:hypothetical protein
MDADTLKRFAEMEDKVNKTYLSVKRIQLYFLITSIVTVAAIVIPLIGLAFVIPQYINQLTSETTSY